MPLARKLKLVTTGEEMPRIDATVKVAFASSDMKRVDQHFGAADSFAVYALNSGQSSFAEAVQFGPEVLDGYEGEGWRGSSAGERQSTPRLTATGQNENKLTAKIEALDGCIAVYCQAVGASAINQLRAKGIQAVKVTAGSRIKVLIEALQEELRTGPNSWLKRAVERHEPLDARRFDRMEQEGWVE